VLYLWLTPAFQETFKQNLPYTLQSGIVTTGHVPKYEVWGSPAPGAAFLRVRHCSLVAWGQSRAPSYRALHRRALTSGRNATLRGHPWPLRPSTTAAAKCAASRVSEKQAAGALLRPLHASASREGSEHVGSSPQRATMGLGAPRSPPEAGKASRGNMYAKAHAHHRPASDAGKDDAPAAACPRVRRCSLEAWGQWRAPSYPALRCRASKSGRHPTGQVCPPPSCPWTTAAATCATCAAPQHPEKQVAGALLRPLRAWPRQEGSEQSQPLPQRATQGQGAR
jgi:hypothetical protein